jgi:LysM repeat protein
MRKSLFILFAQFSLVLLAFGGPKDSLRIEKRDANTFIIHRVIKNEGLPQLAKRYGVSESAILSSNPLLAEKPYPGQLLKIPLNSEKYGDLKAPEVKPLAQSSLPIATTLPTSNDTKKVEDKVVLSTTPEVKAEVKSSGRPIVAFNTYIVSSPQTVQQVANSFSVDANDIIRENDLQIYKLKVGQKIKIPIYSDAPIAKSTEKSVQTVTKKEQEATTNELPVVAAKPIQTKPDLDAPKPAPTKAVAVKKDLDAPKPAPTKPVLAKKDLDEPKGDTTEIVERKVKPLPEVLATKIVKKEEAPKQVEKAPVEESKPLTAAQLKKKAALANIDYLDTTYIHPDGVVYKLFDYRQMDYQFDTRIMRIAEENAIDVEGVNQSKGHGNKKTIHVVKREESLQSIALKYKVSATDIINWNGLLNYRVREGQELVINSERASISPYQRTVVTQATVNPTTSFFERTIKGFAYYDKTKTFKGVYVNDVEKGKFITLQNRDNYEKTIARVIGPLPAGLPKGTIVLIDGPTALDLKVENEKINIQIWINGVTKDEETTSKETN